MLLKYRRQKHQQHLIQLPRLPLAVDKIQTLFKPEEYRLALLDLIAKAQRRIFIVALYLEHDDAGKEVMAALYTAKKNNSNLEVVVLVDWHRAQRGRIGDKAQSTNADWYCELNKRYPEISIPFYGVPINTREALGVLHLKGCIVDDTIIYSGASINDVYLERHDKYRYDRYQLLTQSELADIFIHYIRMQIISAEAVNRLDDTNRPRSPEIKKSIRRFRKQLRHASYQLNNSANAEQLAVIPLVGLGKHSILNRTIHELMCATEDKLIICTPYFNLPGHLAKNVVKLLRHGKQVELVVGDKTANDFYIPEDQPFKIIAAIPYLYEINLRRFVRRLQQYVDNKQLTIRIWKDCDNTFHLKGVWVDDNWQLITGNNLNPRAMRLDLENGILIHDPLQELQEQRKKELDQIRTHTTILTSYQELQSHQLYPEKVRKLIHRLRRIRVDKIINRIL